MYTVFIDSLHTISFYFGLSGEELDKPGGFFSALTEFLFKTW